MIDAVGTFLNTGSPSRVIASAAKPLSGSVAATASTGFITTRIRMDNLHNVAILEVRARDTGEVVNQYPTENQIRAMKKAAELAEKQSVQSAKVEQPDGDTDPSSSSPAPAPAQSLSYSTPGVKVDLSAEAVAISAPAPSTDAPDSADTGA